MQLPIARHGTVAHAVSFDDAAARLPWYRARLMCLATQTVRPSAGLGGQAPTSSLHRLLRVLALAPLIICGLPFAPAVRVSAVPGIQRSTDRSPTPNRVSVYLAGWPPQKALLFSSSAMCHWARVGNTELANCSDMRGWCLSRVPKFWCFDVQGPDLLVLTLSFVC